MSKRRCCCGDEPSIRVLFPCFGDYAAETVWMTEADWAACSFGSGTSVYHWDTGNAADDPYCGTWQFSSSLPQNARQVTGCSDFTLDPTGCCGTICYGPFPPSCCGLQPCFDWIEANNSALVDITTIAGGSGSTTGWSVATNSASVTYLGWTSGKYYYRVNVQSLFTINNISNMTCNGSTSFTKTLDWSFDIEHVDFPAGPSCLVTAFSQDSICDRILCTGTTVDGTYSGSDVSTVTSQQPGITGCPPCPDLGPTCDDEPPYQLAVTTSLGIGGGDLNLCPGDSSARWANNVFPNVSISVTFILSGKWGKP